MAIVYKVRMPDGVPARTDGVDIWIDDRLDEIGELCAIEHELIHIERGHSTLQSEAVEMSVRYEVARRLLPWERLRGGCDGRSLGAAARGFGVTKQVLMDRAATLTDAEAIQAGCGACLRCPALAARFAGHPSAVRSEVALVA